ncbi:MAG: class I SAM-dependent methyltransferase [Actinomycetota bacterium]|nr:class I SAM-dependent methyltransferase [Actinomycetota bacterium]
MPTFDDFRALATDDSLSQYEKIGFPDSYREGAEEAIVEDIAAKLPALGGERNRFLDIGPGCSRLPRMLIELCARRGHRAVLVDSPEMLAQLPDAPNVEKLPGAFPETRPAGPFDAILAYSVVHYVFAEGDVHAFLDRALELLAPGGALLVGDIPNVSKRARFLRSPAGLEFHRQLMDTDQPPPAHLTNPEPGQIDDAVVLGLAARARDSGFDAYVVPLRPDLPLANRREDLLVTRP